jgi:2-polyprenyl-6-hydroxyphenyl methylase/3-demethylubiquinone-9 3-methyltransferase
MTDELSAKRFEHELRAGERFGFGNNWARFLRDLGEDQIAIAEQSLTARLELSSLAGLRFLDVGCGSGLFSLAARRLGAEVHSFDYDPESVDCALELKRRHFPADGRWRIERGSVLESDYMRALPMFDIVYSWGVLHHTGDMWGGLANLAARVSPGGQIYIALYNDQGRYSRMWRTVKRLYNVAPALLKPLIAAVCAIRLRGPSLLRNVFRGAPPRKWLGDTERGMKIWTDIVDWVGGYPFEVAKPEEVFIFLRARGFSLRQLKTCAGGHGCCEYVFVRAAE